MNDILNLKGKLPAFFKEYGVNNPDKNDFEILKNFYEVEQSYNNVLIIKNSKFIKNLESFINSGLVRLEKNETLFGEQLYIIEYECHSNKKLDNPIYKKALVIKNITNRTFDMIYSVIGISYSPNDISSYNFDSSLITLTQNNLKILEKFRKSYDPRWSADKKILREYDKNKNNMVLKITISINKECDLAVDFTPDLLNEKLKTIQNVIAYVKKNSDKTLHYNIMNSKPPVNIIERLRNMYNTFYNNSDFNESGVKIITDNTKILNFIKLYGRNLSNITVHTPIGFFIESDEHFEENFEALIK